MANYNKADRSAQAREALVRAVTGQSLANYVPIIEGFMAKGIPEEDIKPRENVFTFNAWKAAGRVVKKGEHGVKVLSYVERSKEVEKDGKSETRSYRFPKTATVFHVSQTEPLTQTSASVQ